jgi:hypothetical protein
MQHFRLRYRAHDIELTPGEFVVGRSEECQLSIDDAMVSRKHAVFRVTSISVLVVDLGSRNGVSVNGEKLKSERLLVDGDRITIGKHELFLSIVEPSSTRNRGFLARTLGPVELQDLEASMSKVPGSTTGIARVVSSFNTLASLADKNLALGRPEEAERILTAPFGELLKAMKQGALVDATVLGRFATYAIKLATELQKATWVEWIFDTYGLAKLILPAPIIDELFHVAPKLKHLGKHAILDYAEGLSQSTTLTPNDRFLLQRLEGLAKRLATSP